MSSRRIIVALLSATLFCVAPLPSRADRLGYRWLQLSNAIVGIESSAGFASAFGTGFAVLGDDKSIYFVTAAHNIEFGGLRALRVIVTFRDGVSATSEVVMADSKLDLALLAVKKASVSATDRATPTLCVTTHLPLAARVTIAAYDSNWFNFADLNNNRTQRAPNLYEGSINYPSDDLFQYDAGTYPGGSGGPVLERETGIVLGVAISSSTNSPGVNQAVGPRRLVSFLKRATQRLRDQIFFVNYTEGHGFPDLSNRSRLLYIRDYPSTLDDKMRILEDVFINDLAPALGAEFVFVRRDDPSVQDWITLEHDPNPTDALIKRRRLATRNLCVAHGTIGAIWMDTVERGHATEDRTWVQAKLLDCEDERVLDYPDSDHALPDPPFLFERDVVEAVRAGTRNAVLDQYRDLASDMMEMFRKEQNRAGNFVMYGLPIGDQERGAFFDFLYEDFGNGPAEVASVVPGSDAEIQGVIRGVRVAYVNGFDITQIPGGERDRILERGEHKWKIDVLDPVRRRFSSPRERLEILKDGDGLRSITFSSVMPEFKVRRVDSTVVAFDVLPGAAAYNAGLRNGDNISAIDNENLYTSETSYKLLRAINSGRRFWELDDVETRRVKNLLGSEEDESKKTRFIVLESSRCECLGNL